MTLNSQHFQAAITLFDAANALDPNQKELLYAQRMSEMLERFAPEASEVVKLAVHAQHIERWKIPRARYSMNRTGYLQWRRELYQYHAERAGQLMKEAGYDDAMIARTQTVISKKGLKVNPETQLMEDVVDLVFIEHYLSSFASQHPEYDEAKWMLIIRKTWAKMSDRAHEFALAGKIRLPEALVPLILKAINV
ncbi:MAG: DUF4202 domain-containing protein [Deltaproteobacteria bacterium]|nr:DUF4202 domain-containing protein [Deltaproteobacteria bacterium]